MKHRSITAFAVVLALSSAVAPSAPAFAHTAQQPTATAPGGAPSATTTGSASMPMEVMEMEHGHMGMSGGQGHPGPQKHPAPMMGDGGDENAMPMEQMEMGHGHRGMSGGQGHPGPQ